MRPNDLPGESRRRVRPFADPVSLVSAEEREGAIRCAPTRAHLRTETITTLQPFLDLEDQWDQLVRNSQTDRAFFSHAWFRAWWDAFGNGKGLFVVCVWNGDSLVGAAPLYRIRGRFKGLPVRELLFMANGYSEESGIIIDASESNVLETMFSYLSRECRDWDLMNLNRVRLDSALWRERNECFVATGLSLQTSSSMRVPYVEIDRGWQEFLASKSRKFRKTLRSRANKISRSQEAFATRKITDSDEICAALPELLRISSASWKAGEGRSLTSSEEDIQLFRNLSREFADKGWVSLWIAYVGKQPIAFEYHLSYQGVSSPIRADFDEAYRALSPGAYLESEIIRALFEDPDRAIREYNSCADSYPYVLKWTKKAHLHADLFATRRNAYGRLLHRLSGLRRPRLEPSERAKELNESVPSNAAHKSLLERAADVLRNEGLVAFTRRSLSAIRHRTLRSNSANWYCCELATPAIEPKRPLGSEIEFDSPEILGWLENLQSDFGWAFIEEEVDVATRLTHLLPLARIDDRKAGYLKVGIAEAYVTDFEATLNVPTRSAYIYDSFVHPDYRGHGIAQWMIAATLEELRSRGFERVWCHIPRWNAASIAAYEHSGFRKIAFIGYVRLLGWRIYSKNPERLMKNFEP